MMNADEQSTLDVLHVTQPTTEGIAKVVRQMIDDQCQHGLSVGLACPNTPDFVEPLRQAGCRWYEWDAVRSPHRGVLKELMRLHQIVSQSSPRVLHLHSSKAGMIGRALVRGKIPTVFQPNGWSFRVGSRLQRALAYQFEVFAAQRWTTIIHCVSHSEQDAIGHRLPPHKLTLIPNGVDLQSWDQIHDVTKQAARRQLGLPLDVPLVVALGRVTRQKGPDLLVQCWPRIQQTSPHAHLVWAGEGDLRNELINQTRDQPQIQFCGSTKTPKLYFTASDVVVMPSRWEGHSLSLLEALATKRPVIAFDVEGMRDTLQPEFGSVISPGDLEAFADAVASWLDKEHTSGSHAGTLARAHVEHHFDLKVMCSRVKQLYQSIQRDDADL